MKPVFEAAIFGTFPDTSGGLEITVPCAGVAYEDWVAMEDVEFERVGEDCRTVGPSGAAGGDAAVDKLEEVRWWWLLVLVKGDGGAMVEVGVAIGVFCVEDTAVPLTTGCFAVGTSPVYICPSSPAAKVRVEQKPSDELMSNVRPSLDLLRALARSEGMEEVLTKSSL